MCPVNNLKLLTAINGGLRGVHKRHLYMTSAEDAVKHYLNLVNQHDIPAAMACLADTFELRFRDSDYVMTKESLAHALGWDKGVNGHLEYVVAESGGAEVIIEGHESNDFLSLLGIVALSFRSTFNVDKDNLINRQVHHVDWGAVTMDTAMKPLIDWAGANEPEELEQILPEGRMIYTEEAARRWVAVARRWRAAHAG